MHGAHEVVVTKNIYRCSVPAMVRAEEEGEYGYSVRLYEGRDGILHSRLKGAHSVHFICTHVYMYVLMGINQTFNIFRGLLCCLRESHVL